jgi:hypothetical protein
VGLVCNQALDLGPVNPLRHARFSLTPHFEWGARHGSQTGTVSTVYAANANTVKTVKEETNVFLATSRIEVNESCVTFLPEVPLLITPEGTSYTGARLTTYRASCKLASFFAHPRLA